jgi:uncharacterized RDD family membrane protein YckC
VFMLVAVILLTAVSSLDAAAMAAVQVGLFLLVLVGVPISVETLSRGRSVGKAMCGLRVVREDGGPIRFRHALVRGALGVIEIQLFFGVVACAASLVSERGRRLGDVFAGTLVVRERVPVAKGRSAPPPPPWLAGRFGGLDLSQVPGGLWLAVRQYLMRAGQLDEHVSRSMAERLAADLVSCTGVPAPTGVPAAAYLAGVVAERQAREAQRTFGAGVQSAAAPASLSVSPSGSHSASTSASVPAGATPQHPWAPVSAPSAVSSLQPAGEGQAPPSDSGGAGSDAPAPGEKRSTGFVPPT